MTYSPTIITVDTVNSGVFKNVYGVIDAYKPSNSSVMAGNNEVDASKPIYCIFPFEGTQDSKTFDNAVFDRFAMIHVDMVAPARQGWIKADEMLDLADKGFRTEKDDLNTARLSYRGYDVVSIDPMEVNGQQVFIKAVVFKFKVLM